MMRNLLIIRWIIFCLIISGCSAKLNKKGPYGNLYEYSDALPRWSSPENPNGQKGKGAMENHGAKGRASSPIPKGTSLSLLDIQGQGIIGRIWITINDRSPGMLRGLKLEMFWDNEAKPAVSAPLGDFFGMGLGRMTAFHNVFFADPEGKSFNCLIPMPFKTGARIVVTNESEQDLGSMFFDVDYQLTQRWDRDNLYFHAYWHRDTATILAKDFELLPNVQGRGRFLGSNVGINSHPRYKELWWGEGEVKMYLDGDADFPTLAGTGTEDYIGTGWGQGKFFTDYTGCLIADGKLRQWGFYRFHVPDPIYFSTGCRVTIQQMGGGPPKEVEELQKAGVPLIIATTSEGWDNFFRSDDVSATAYFYLDKPSDGLPGLQSVAMRAYNLK
ncbi:MAG: DUF2961 domain-containing protein [Chitinophagaceae bacterium]|nr:DUF2961 domain-containing protein [Chitinophagaceae bacterium]